MHRTREPRSKCYGWNSGAFRQAGADVKLLLRAGNKKGAKAVLSEMFREIRCQDAHFMYRDELVDAAADYFEENS